MLQKLAATEKAPANLAARVPAMLRTHPLTAARVEAVRAALPEALSVFNKHCSVLQQGWQDVVRVFS
jgi:predicted Zn-dependent protease